VSKRQRRHDQGDRDAERRKAGSVARRATRDSSPPAAAYADPPTSALRAGLEIRRVSGRL